MASVGYSTSNSLSSAWKRGWSRRGSQTGSSRSRPTENSHGIEGTDQKFRISTASWVVSSRTRYSHLPSGLQA